ARRYTTAPVRINLNGKSAAARGRTARPESPEPRASTRPSPGRLQPAPPGADTFTAANRQFARSVLLGLVLVGVIGMFGPVLNYRADVAAIREQFQGRIARESQMYAQALRLHFELLQNDLERLALRPEIDLFDGTTAPEQVLLDHTHHGSALFGVGVAVLDL